MRSGTREIHWDSPMIATQRAHFDPKKGDRKAAIRDVANNPVGRDGIRAIDMNFQVAATVRKSSTGKRFTSLVAYAMHWVTPGPNGYLWVIDAKTHRKRRMTKTELRRPLNTWGPDGVDRWRDARGEAPMRYREAVKYAAAHGVVIIAELKSLWFRTVRLMESMVQAAKDAGHPAWFMALYGSMRGCQQKAEATTAAGGEFLVIFGRYRAKYARRTPAGPRWWSKPGITVERAGWAGA